jgi:1-acyl-sn-glycerol-3-phosphate acyltransferase
LDLRGPKSGSHDQAVSEDAFVPRKRRRKELRKKERRTIESKRYRPAKEVNFTFYRYLAVFFRKALKFLFNLHPVGQDAIPRKGPVLLLANHANLFDPIWLYDMIHRPIHYVVTENVFRSSFLDFLIHNFGGFPTRKEGITPDVLKNIKQLLKKGQVVGVYPEGIRTWNGLTYTIREGIATMIRIFKVPVVCCRLEGAYLSLPRWAIKYRRIPIRGVFKRLYDADTIPSSKAQIIEDISSFLESREYELTYDERRYRSSGLASNISTLLYRCPNCHVMEGLKVVKPLKTNRIQCASCASAWRITLSGRMIPLDENHDPISQEMTWAECYQKIKALPLYAIRASRLLELQEDECLYLSSGPMLLKTEIRFPIIRDIGSGQMYLTDRRLLFIGEGGVYLDAPLQEIGQVATDPGGQFYFTHSKEQSLKKRYLIIIKSESILKWSDTLIRLRDGLSKLAP